MNFKKMTQLAGAFILVLIFFGCSKPALYGTLQENEAMVKYYQVSPEAAYRAAKEALVYLGYSLKKEDPEKKFLETFWQPTTADSHYVEVFGRRDYGTVGAYYRMVVKITPRRGGSQVSIINAAKSFISNLKSSQRQEVLVFEKVDDFTRKRDIQVTNIGLQ